MSLSRIRTETHQEGPSEYVSGFDSIHHLNRHSASIPRFEPRHIAPIWWRFEDEWTGTTATNQSNQCRRSLSVCRDNEKTQMSDRIYDGPGESSELSPHVVQSGYLLSVEPPSETRSASRNCDGTVGTRSPTATCRKSSLHSKPDTEQRGIIRSSKVTTVRTNLEAITSGPTLRCRTPISGTQTVAIGWCQDQDSAGPFPNADGRRLFAESTPSNPQSEQ